MPVDDVTKDGDQEVNELVVNHMRLATGLAIEKANATPAQVSFEELQAVAYFGLVDAAKRFDPAKDVKFTTYASIRIFGQMQDYLRSLDFGARSKRVDKPKMTPLDVFYDGEEYGYSEAYEQAAALQREDTGLHKIHTREFFAKTFEYLLDKEREVMTLYYLEDLSMQEVGKRLSISESRVSQITKRCRGLIKSRWSEEEFRALIYNIK